MMSLDEFDFQFLDEGLLLENDAAGSVNISNIFDLEPENPVYGNDLSLASVLNPDDENLVYAPTDTWGVLTDKNGVHIDGTSTNVKAETQTSPWHESDSGVSDATYLGSPQSFTMEENGGQDLKTQVAQQNSKRMDFLTLENFDVDVDGLEEFQDQDSPCSYSALSPSTKINLEISNSYEHDEPNVSSLEGGQQVEALEFFKSDSFSHPSHGVKVLTIPAATRNTGNSTDGRSRKNAIQAKVNREKKKAYIKSLEDEIKTLKGLSSPLALAFSLVFWVALGAERQFCF